MKQIKKVLRLEGAIVSIFVIVGMFFLLAGESGTTILLGICSVVMALFLALFCQIIRWIMELILEEGEKIRKEIQRQGGFAGTSAKSHSNFVDEYR